MANPTKIIPTKASTSQEWIQWHKAMRGRYGLKEANVLFVKAWGLRAGSGTSASTIELREYMNEAGVRLDTNSLEDVLDTTSAGLDAIGDVFTTGKYAVLAIGVIVIGGLGMLVFNVAKQPLKAASTVTGARRLK